VSERLVTASELAEHVGLKPGTVLDKWERGEFPGYKFGRAVRFDLDEILALGRREGDTRGASGVTRRGPDRVA
jgi:excisionase family DNA binding protein